MHNARSAAKTAGMNPPPKRLSPGDPELAQVLDLIRSAFAGMAGRIDPPSSMLTLDPDALVRQCRSGEIWAVGTPVFACIFLTPQPDALYVGKLAVAETQRGKGRARALLDLADKRARSLGLPRLRLQTRVELTENQALFTALGFRETGRTAHAGYTRPTSITYQRPVAARSKR